MGLQEKILSGRFNCCNAVICVNAILLIIFFPSLSASAADPAPKRVTPIAVNLKGTGSYTESYAQAGNGFSIEGGGTLPLANAGGKGAIKFAVGGKGGWFAAGLARNNWVRWYLDDYLPDGLLEFEVMGEAGGEQFKIGLKDSGATQPDKKEVQAMVSVGKYAKVTKDWQAVRIPIKDLVAAAEKVNLADCMCVLVGQEGDKAGTFFLREIRFTTATPEKLVPPIKVNQLGYLPDMTKIAKITAECREVKVFAIDGDKQVATAPTRKVADKDPASGENVWEADFSAVTAPGKYILKADGLEPSAPFEIRADIYASLFRDSMRFYYLQRCGSELDEKHAGKWARPACHFGDRKAVTRDGKDERDVTGGWHDAGDCNKYPCFVRIPLFMMMDIYDLKHASRIMADGALNIPGEGDGVSDVIKEAMWELDWLLKMQIRDGSQSGAVYDRIHQSAAPGGKKAERLQEERRLLPPTADSTATSAAVWARAARTIGAIEKNVCKGAAKKYLEAAELAYKRLEADKAPQAHMLLVSACLYDATGEVKYLTAAQANFGPVTGDPAKDTDLDRLSWGQQEEAVIVLATSARDGGGLRDKARKFLSALADKAVANAAKDGFGVPLWLLDHYCWSSSANIGKFGYVCIMANTFNPKKQYVQLAQDCLHYLLGRNALDLCFVTGYGTRQTVVYSSVYGGSSAAFQPTPPGLIGGGVNQFESRGISAWPAKNYRSDPNNWTLTEVAIYYNAPLVFLAGFFSP